MLPLSRQSLTMVSEGTPAPHTTQQRPIPYGSCSVPRVWVQAGSKQKEPHCSPSTSQGWDQLTWREGWMVRYKESRDCSSA